MHRGQQAKFAWKCVGIADLCQSLPPPPHTRTPYSTPDTLRFIVHPAPTYVCSHPSTPTHPHQQCPPPTHTLAGAGIPVEQLYAMALSALSVHLPPSEPEPEPEAPSAPDTGAAPSLATGQPSGAMGAGEGDGEGEEAGGDGAESGGSGAQQAQQEGGPQPMEEDAAAGGAGAPLLAGAGSFTALLGDLDLGEGPPAAVEAGAAAAPAGQPHPAGAGGHAPPQQAQQGAGMKVKLKLKPLREPPVGGEPEPPPQREAQQQQAQQRHGGGEAAGEAPPRPKPLVLRMKVKPPKPPPDERG